MIFFFNGVLLRSRFPLNLKIDFDEYIKQHDIDTSDMKTLAKAYKKFYEKNEKTAAVQEEGRAI